MKKKSSNSLCASPPLPYTRFKRTQCWLELPKQSIVNIINNINFLDHQKRKERVSFVESMKNNQVRIGFTDRGFRSMNFVLIIYQENVFQLGILGSNLTDTWPSFHYLWFDHKIRTIITNFDACLYYRSYDIAKRNDN